jgi:hypothetical protein
MPLRPIGVVLVLIASLCAQRPGTPPKPQTVFNSSNPVHKLQLTGVVTTEPPQPTIAQPISIPPRILELLKDDALHQELMQRALMSIERGDPTMPTEWLAASEIDLGCTRGVLIVGQGPLRGTSHAAPFWIFVTDASGNYRQPLGVVADRVEFRGHGTSCRELRTSLLTGDDQLRMTSFRLKDAKFVRHRSWYDSPNVGSTWHFDTGLVSHPQGPQIQLPRPTDNPR